MPKSVNIVPTVLATPSGPSNRLVAALVYDQLCSFEFGCAVEIFGLPRPEFGDHWYQFVTCAAEPGPMCAVGGMAVTAEADLCVLARAGTVIIPGWKGADIPPSAELIAALRAAPRIANQVARRLVMAPHRNGGQAQFIERPVQARADNRLSSVIAQLAERIDEPFTIASMARAAAMSPRTFMRRFREATGRSPAEWLIDARIERARELLETTELGIDAIATHCGFGSGATLRHHFRRKVTLSPIAYREQFARELPPVSN